MGEKNLNRTVVIGTTVLCVVLLSCLVGAVIAYNSMLADKDSRIENKDLKIADKTSQINDIETILAESQSEIDDLSSQIAQKNSTITALNQQIGKKDSQISDLNSQISQKESTIKNLNNQDSIIADLNDEISDLNSQILTLKSQIASLQTQNDDATSEITTLNSEMAHLQLAYDNFVAAYQNLRDVINQRSIPSNISDFITPQDPEVTSMVYSITGGWSNISDWNEFWTDVKALYIWIRTNIEYRSDGVSPVLPFNPANIPYYQAEMWQFPNETLELEKGDCEDQAILLCSMIRCYTDTQFTECIWITSSSTAHVAVQIPLSGDELVIFDPAGNYYSKDILGNVVFNDISVEIDNWLNYWKSQGIGSDVYVYRVFSDYLDEAFSSTSEYLSWMHS